MTRLAIYAADGKLLRWIVSDNDSITVQNCGAAAGESALVIPDVSYGDKYAIQAFVSQITGLIPVPVIPLEAPAIPPTPATEAEIQAHIAAAASASVATP